ncbi:unnamed protein product, partial [Mesorhabditis belari]|uniref:RRM domain-containing protein n=1 Tax=Mesorhabditis belari TaxID=2138241 RepID=A0AAF3F3Z0_9BILA
MYAIRGEGSDPMTYHFELNAKGEEGELDTSTMSTDAANWQKEEQVTTKPTEGPISSENSEQNKPVETEEKMVTLAETLNEEIFDSVDQEVSKGDEFLIPENEHLEMDQSTEEIPELNDAVSKENTNIDEELKEGISDDKMSMNQTVKSISDGEKHLNEEKSSATETNKEKSDEAKDADESAARSFWVRNLPGGTKAAELKALFSTIGKVERAKIFTSKKVVNNANAFGFVTMTEKNDLELAIETLNRKEFKGRVLTLERADKSRLPTAKANAPTSTSISPSTDPKGKKRAGDEKRQIVSSNPEANKSRERTTREKHEIRGNGSRHKEPERRRTEIRSLPHRPRVFADRDRAFNDRRRHVAPATNSRDRPLLRGYAPQGHRGNRPTRGFRGGFGRAVSSRAISQRVSYPERESANTSSRFGSRQSSSSLRANDGISSRQLEELLRLKEQESERKVREMQLTMERERIRYEKEKLERKLATVEALRHQNLQDHREITAELFPGFQKIDIQQEETLAIRDAILLAMTLIVENLHVITSLLDMNARNQDRALKHRVIVAIPIILIDAMHQGMGALLIHTLLAVDAFMNPSQGSSRDYHGAGVSSTGYSTATLPAISGYPARNISLPTFDTSGFTAGATSGFAWPTLSNPTIQSRTTFKNSDYTFAGSSDLSGGRHYDYTRRY